MEKYYLSFHKALNSGDREVKTWFLVGHDYLPFIMVVCYIIFSCYLGPALMKNRKPFDLRVPMVIFNFSLVLAYVITTFKYFGHVREVDYEIFCKKGTVIKGTPQYRLIRNMWVIYILKYIEFFDTVFFILRKKQHLVTTLHVIHHALVPILGWIVFRTEENCIQSIPTILNAIVHIIMYTYYGLAAMGPQMRQYLWWKKYLTQLQMIQFLLMLGFVFIVAPLMGCHMVVSSYFISIVFPIFFLHLFYQFYKASFHPQKTVTNGTVTNGTVTNGTVTNGTAKMEESTNGHVVNGVTHKASEKHE